ncbi:unnamed protein product, partial [Meganyctiphanes norvegica]
GVGPLHKACQNGHHDAAKALLAKGCQRQPTDCNGNTPLHYAAFTGMIQLGKLLLDNGHELLIKNTSGNTPLDEARNFGQLEFVNWMMKNYQVEFYNKPSQVECRQSYEDIVQEFMYFIANHPSSAILNIRSGLFDVHLQDMQRQTALHIAATLGDLESVQ